MIEKNQTLRGPNRVELDWVEWQEPARAYARTRNIVETDRGPQSRSSFNDRPSVDQGRDTLALSHQHVKTLKLKGRIRDGSTSLKVVENFVDSSVRTGNRVRARH